MDRFTRMLPMLAIALATGLVVACGGGGGGGGGTLPGGGGGNPSPSPAGSPAITGAMQISTGGALPSPGISYAPAGNAGIVFSCGCTGQAGTATADANGNFTLPHSSPATPSAPDPTYTIVPGRNYIVVATSAAGAEAWTLEFAGKIPSHNHSLNASNMSDAYTAAAALYVFQNSPGGVTAFDQWNFNAVSAWVAQLQSAPNASETTLLNDIAGQSALNKTLYPDPPGWNPGQPINAKIKTDLNNVKTSGDALIPTPCPASPCAGQPTP